MKEYLELVYYVLHYGEFRNDRTGTNTLSLFGQTMQFGLQNTFPILTNKFTNFEASAGELLWMLSGSTNVNDLNSHIWDKWADEQGELGPIYGKQWRAWDKYGFGSIDQIERLEHGLKNDPLSRRHILSAWNVADLDQMALQPCHMFSQFYVTKPVYSTGQFRLDCQVYLRSNDLFLGAPFNICMYGLLIKMLAKVHGFEAGYLYYVVGDAHLYINHLEGAREMLSRPEFPLPTLHIETKPKSILDYTLDDFELIDYNYHPRIKAPIAV